MSEANQLINNVEQGIDALLSKVSKLSLVVKNQEEKIEGMIRLSENYKTENTALNDQISRLKLQTQNGNSDSEKIGQYKSKIKELVKEIDSCISLLNG